MKPRHAFVCGLVFLAGCAGDHNHGVRALEDEGAHLAVPFFPDRRDQWGPASLASVLTFWGRPATPEGLRHEIHFPKQRGSVALDLKYAARARGLDAEMSTGGTLGALKGELDAGRPVIVLINTAARLVPIRSFMVVTGYNEWLHGVYAHFGPNKDYFLKYSQFETDWKKAGGWMLLVSEKQSPPVKPELKPRPSAPPIVEVEELAPPRVAKKRARPRPRPRVECRPLVPGDDVFDPRCPAPATEAIR